MLFQDVSLPKFKKRDFQTEIRVKEIVPQEPAFLNLIKLQQNRDSKVFVDPDIEEKVINVRRKVSFIRKRSSDSIKLRAFRKVAKPVPSKQTAKSEVKPQLLEEEP